MSVNSLDNLDNNTELSTLIIQIYHLYLDM